MPKYESAEAKDGELYWKYHAPVTNEKEQSARVVVVGHLRHANMENAIKEHKSGLGVEKLPTPKFHTNWTYLLIGQLAFNLVGGVIQALGVVPHLSAGDHRDDSSPPAQSRRQARPYRPPRFLAAL